LVQETFIKAWRGWESVRGAVQGWLYRIAHNVVASYQRRPTLVLAPLDDAEQAEDTLDAIEAYDERERIEETLSTLAPHYASALRLTLDGGNLPQKYLAQRAGIDVQNFRAHVSRGRKQFAAAYQKGA
jgi:RNA polymerase sigma factor (sigma-70 family)